jgi:serine/threonine protein kinase
MRVNKKTLSLQTVTRLMEHTLKGLMFLKEKNIAHLDMKPNNIIVSSDLSAKLSDFG